MLQNEPRMKIKIDEKRLSKYCSENHIKKLSFFGSVLTDKFNETSDVDALVEFEKDYVPGLLGMNRMERELSALIERKVDLHTKEELSKHFRESVVREAEVKYGA